MKYLSVCSGIEAATVAWHPMGWEPFGFSEVEKFPGAVLAHHYPETPNFGDMTKFKEWPDATVDVLVGGTPCQSFSVAGLRKGLDDPRGNLMLTYVAIAKRYRPKWLVWENVPGVLSSNGGRDFGTLLTALAECGYGFAYRVLDAQYFGLAQRRKRVFLVGCLGDWRSAAAILFERESLSGDSAPSREAGEAVTGTLSSRTTGGGGLGTDFECAAGVQPYTVGTGAWPAQVAATLNAAFGSKQGLEDQHALGGASLFVPDITGPLTAGMSKGPRGNEAVDSGWLMSFPANLSGTQHTSTENLAPSMGAANPTAVAYGFQPRIARNGRGDMGDLCSTLSANAGETGKGDSAPCVAFAQNSRDELREMPYIGALSANAGMKQTSYVRQAMAVRRLTPTECERLQGFPDGYTDIKPKGKQTPDGPRYKALGNSMAVPCMRWIGERIQRVQEITG